jgi:FMN-dependent NADH-azoreductase
MRVLHIDSSITGAHSVSRELTAATVAQVLARHGGSTVQYRDLAASPVPHQSEALISARAGAPWPDAQSERQAAAAEAALVEFIEADIVVIGAPMYNFSIPSQLKAWLDSLAIAGQTFRYTEHGAESLCKGKHIVIVSSRGGNYTPPSPMAAMDHQESLLAGFFAFLGQDVKIIRAEGVMMGPEPRETAIAAARAEISQLAFA